MEEQPNDLSHSPRVTQNGDDLCIPFGIRGVTSCFPARKLTAIELANCRTVDLTSEEPEWDPSSNTFQEQENATVDASGMVHNTGDGTNRRFISIVRVSRNQAEAFVQTNSQCSAVLTNIDPNPHADHLLESLKENAKVSSTATGKRKGNLTAERLAKDWGTSLDSAKQTLKVTAQPGARTAANPSPSRQFRTNDRQLRHHRLRCDMCADTLDAKKVKSHQGNTHAQIFATQFGWHRAFPMKAKLEAHKAVLLLFARDGVPVNMVMLHASMSQQALVSLPVRLPSVCQVLDDPDLPWLKKMTGIGASEAGRSLTCAGGVFALQFHNPLSFPCCPPIIIF
jgi:hypothetical protein